MATDVAARPTAVVPRDPDTGQLLPGAVLNPRGRGEGNRSLITRQKQELEIALRAYPALQDHLVAVLQRIVIQAKQGDRKSQKLLMDKFMSNAVEADPRDDNSDREFRLVILNLTSEDMKKKQAVEAEAVEGEFTEVEPEDE